MVRRLRRSFPVVWVSVSVTTRFPRPNERDGVNYFFVDRPAFQQMIDSAELLEWAEFDGNLYGTPRAPVEHKLADGTPVILEIELEGARQVRRAFPAAVLVFLEPPSWQVLAERLSGRGTEPAEVVQRRLQQARDELAAVDEFDVRLVNHDVASVCRDLVALLLPAATTP